MIGEKDCSSTRCSLHENDKGLILALLWAVVQFQRMIPNPTSS